MILDLGFRQRRPLNHAPHHRLRPAIELVAHCEFQQFAGNPCLGVEVHRRVGVGEVADDAQPLELRALDGDPVLCIGAAFAAEGDHGGRVRQVRLGLALRAIVLFLDLPLDRQAVAVPARHVVGIVAAHLERARDDVLEDLVQRMADMDVAVGIGRAVMQHVFRASGGVLAQQLVEAHFLPAGHDLRLLLRQAGAHGEVGLWQIERLGIVELVGGHRCSDLESCHPVAGAWARAAGQSVRTENRGVAAGRQKPGPSGRSTGRPGR